MKDFYQILGVSESAETDEIRKAYRKLARKYHPDVSKEPDAEDRFKELGEAYEVLKDEKKRKAYDHMRKYGGDPFGGGGFEYTGEDASEFDFSSLFETLFGGARHGGGRESPFGGGGRSRGFQQKGQTVRAQINVDLVTAVKGGEERIRLDTGSGEKSLSVKIPAGIEDGQKIRLTGQGAAGFGGGPDGDLILEVGIKPNRDFQVEGRNLLTYAKVAPWEAALGAKVPVKTIDGEVNLTIPAGSQSGKRLRLKGKGFGGKNPGDLLVEIRIVVPPADNDAVKNLYKELETVSGFEPR